MSKPIQDHIIRRMNMLAELVSEGFAVHHAGQTMMGMTKGETAHCWRHIKTELGRQAS